MSTIRAYLTNLITEKGSRLDRTLDLDGHIGLTLGDLVDFIDTMPEHHAAIRKTLVMIDFKNGDVFHFLNHLAQGMAKALTW